MLLPEAWGGAPARKGRGKKGGKRQGKSEAPLVGIFIEKAGAWQAETQGKKRIYGSPALTDGTEAPIIDLLFKKNRMA